MAVKPRIQAFILVISLMMLVGCVLRNTHTVSTRVSTATLREATLEQLAETINTNGSKLQSLNANVDIAVSTGGEKKGKVTDYRTFSGYVLVRKPEMLRMIGLVPVVRNRMFDMVSDGRTFELSVPPKNKFYVGSAQKPGDKKVSDQAIENLRPQDIFDALLLRPIDPQNEIAVLEQSTEMVKDPKTHKDAIQSNYVVVVIRKGSNGSFYLSRRIVFSRTDLLPHEQWIYNQAGQLVTYAHYDNFVDHAGIMLPATIEIQRPVEEYAITLTVTKANVNVPLRDDQFSLQQPSGSQLINVDQQRASGSGTQGLSTAERR